jgi:hypothetical protein
MFTYCVEVLHLSEPAAYKRIQAARAARRFPAILEMVARGELHLTAVKLLAPHLRRENLAELLAAARHRTKREIEGLVAERFPSAEPQTKPSMRRLPGSALAADAPAAEPLFARMGETAEEAAMLPPAPAVPLFARVGETAEEAVTLPPAAAVPLFARVGETAEEAVTLPPAPAEPRRDAPSRTPAPPTPPAPVGEPEERWRLQVTLGKVTHDKLLQAQALLRHQVPDGDVAAVLDRALGVLVKALLARKFAVREARPRGRGDGRARSRHVPSDVRRAVFARDGARCTFAAEDGRRCGETAFLELEHLRPWALGGTHDAANLTIRCRAHNQHAAEAWFGAEVVAAQRGRARRS